MPWDFSSARTCAVSHPVLVESTIPVLETAAHATISPLPYGVGVYSVDSSGTKTELPLYYVSPKAASKGERNVEAGWYVAAVPGQSFELRVTAIQAEFPRVRGESLKEGYGVNATLFVDGTSARKFRFDSSCGETWVTGFI